MQLQIPRIATATRLAAQLQVLVLDGVFESGLGVGQGGIWVHRGLGSMRQWRQDSRRAVCGCDDARGHRLLTHLKSGTLNGHAVGQEASHGYFVGLCSLVHLLDEDTLFCDGTLRVVTNWLANAL